LLFANTQGVVVADFFWLTFRLDDRAAVKPTYSERYKALQDAIKDVSTALWWKEPTSFVAFESELDIDGIVAILKKAIHTSHDVVLVREMNSKTARVCGAVADQDIFKLMPYLKKA
jgi:hypothetical protein